MRGIGGIDLASIEAEWAALDAKSEEHTSELQSPMYLVCRRLREKKSYDERGRNQRNWPPRLGTIRCLCLWRLWRDGGEVFHRTATDRRLEGYPIRSPGRTGHGDI